MNTILPCVIDRHVVWWVCRFGVTLRQWVMLAPDIHHPKAVPTPRQSCHFLKAPWLCERFPLESSCRVQACTCWCRVWEPNDAVPGWLREPAPLLGLGRHHCTRPGNYLAVNGFISASPWLCGGIRLLVLEQTENDFM